LKSIREKYDSRKTSQELAKLYEDLVLNSQARISSLEAVKDELMAEYKFDSD